MMGVSWKCTLGESDVKTCWEEKCESAPATPRTWTSGSNMMQQKLGQEKADISHESTSVGMLEKKLDKLQQTLDQQTTSVLQLLEEKEQTKKWISRRRSQNLPGVTAFTANTTAPLEGGLVTLTCVATGTTVPTFSLNTHGRPLDGHFYSVAEKGVSTSGSVHTATYQIKAKIPNVLRRGEQISCKADYGRTAPPSTKSLTITTYYDCGKIEPRILGDVSNAKIDTTDNGDGTYTRTITCPPNTDNVRYHPMTSSTSAVAVTCSKTTGRYEPPFLARCVETRPLTEATGQQTMRLPSHFPAVCAPTSAPEYQPQVMKKKLLSMTDSVCGFRHVVPCLKTGQCTLDSESSGCRWSGSARTLVNFYKVRFNKPVWSIKERDALGRKQAGQIKFWGCEQNYT